MKRLFLIYRMVADRLEKLEEYHFLFIVHFQLFPIIRNKLVLKVWISPLHFKLLTPNDVELKICKVLKTLTKPYIHTSMTQR